MTRPIRMNQRPALVKSNGSAIGTSQGCFSICGTDSIRIRDDGRWLQSGPCEQGSCAMPQVEQHGSSTRTDEHLVSDSMTYPILDSESKHRPRRNVPLPDCRHLHCGRSNYRGDSSARSNLGRSMATRITATFSVLPQRTHSKCRRLTERRTVSIRAKHHFSPAVRTAGPFDPPEGCCRPGVHSR